MGLNPLVLLEGNMAFEGGGVPALWSYNEYNENIDELNKRLHDTTMELQNFQLNAMEELKKKEEDIQSLVHLLKKTCQERDEAREQLQIVLKRVMTLNYLEPNSESPQATKSDNSLSYASSPIEPFFDVENSPELSNMNMADSHHIGVTPTKAMYSNNVRYEQLVSNNKRALPEKGKLLDAVMKAGPLLQSLLVAGSLPRWNNPPPVQPLSIPSISVTSPNSQKLNQAAALTANVFEHNSVNGLHNENTMATVKRPMAVAVAVAMSMASPCLSGKRQRSQ